MHELTEILHFFAVKIGLFYVVYYAFLTGFFIAMLVIFYQTLDDTVPKWQNSNGIIGSNPGKKTNHYWLSKSIIDISSASGVGYRPGPSKDHVESTLVYFRHGELGNWKSWAERLDEFLTGKDGSFLFFN